MNTFLTLKKTTPALALLGLALSGCQPELSAPEAGTAGTADFTSYVAVGNSLTAGYSDGGLYNEAQATSYPAILAQQFAKTGKGPSSFVQPVFADNQKDGSGYIKLQIVNGAATPVQPSAANQFLGEQLAVIGVLPASGQKQLAPFTGGQPDNMGIPGISVLSSVASLTGGLAPYGLINPFYERLLASATEKGTKDYVTYIGQKTPTFFTMWMGSNDVLGYALTGGVVDPKNPFGAVTDTTRFGIGYRALMTQITKNGTVKGVVANIPNVANIPYFTTVRVAAVAAGFLKANPASPGVFIQTGSTNTVRLATTGDLITLPASSLVATGVGSLPTNPIPNELVLDATELASVTTATTRFNTIIAKTALKYKVPVADMNTFFNNIATGGVVINGTNNSATFASGNLFSLDGVHPTPRGYAVVANEFIRVINANYGSSIPSVNPNDYRAVLFP
jgi:lysophospholipase L1-like esterase